MLKPQRRIRKCRVAVDLGCGTGRPIGEYILERGFLLTGIDQSARMLELARQRLPRGQWLESVALADPLA